MSRYAEPADTETDDIPAEMERTVFAPHEFEIPVGAGIKLPRIRKKRCACCGRGNISPRSPRLWCEWYGVNLTRGWPLAARLRAR